MAVVLETGQAASMRLYDLNNDDWTGIVYGYDSASGGQAFHVSTALAAAYTADKAVRSDIAVLATQTSCVLDCAGNPVAAPSTITITPGGLTPTFEVIGGPSYDWDFGDTQTGQGNPVTHTYALAGTYTVTAIPMASTCLGLGTTSVTVA